VRDLLQQLVAVALGDQPQEVRTSTLPEYGGTPTAERFG
jgi:hypothetical protein